MTLVSYDVDRFLEPFMRSARTLQSVSDDKNRYYT